MKKRRILTATILLGLVFVFYLGVRAENNQFLQKAMNSHQSLDTSFPIATVTGDQSFVRTSYNSKDQECLVVWTDYRALNEAEFNSPGLIYGQRVSLSGELLGDEIPISADYQDFSRALPASAYDPVHNEYLVVYLRNKHLYGRFLNSNGSFRGEEFVICDVPPRQMHPSVDFNPTYGNYFVTWNDYRVKGETDIYGVFVNRDSSLDGDEFLICGAPKDQFYPATAYNSIEDEFMVVWEEFRYCTLDPCYSDLSKLYARRVNSDGDLLGEEIIVMDGGHDNRQQNLIYNPDRNEYMIAWNDRRNESDVANIDIFARRIKHDGTLFKDFPICTVPNDQGYCTVAYDPFHKTYLAVWNDFREKDPEVLDNSTWLSTKPYGGANVIFDPGTVYALWLNDEGEPIGSEFMLCEESKGYQMLAFARYYATSKNDGTFFVAWSDMRNEGNGRDIYGKFMQAPLCPATMLLEDETSLNILRKFRDKVLNKIPEGKEIIRLYYEWSPAAVKAMEEDESFKEKAKEVLEGILPLIRALVE